MPRPEPDSAADYAREGIFEEKLREGFTYASFGQGPWIGFERIVAMWAFFHPDGIISTYEHPKFEDERTGMTMRSNPYGQAYTTTTFEEHLEKFKIKLSTKVELKEIIKEYDTKTLER